MKFSKKEINSFSLIYKPDFLFNDVDFNILIEFRISKSLKNKFLYYNDDDDDEENYHDYSYYHYNNYNSEEKVDENNTGNDETTESGPEVRDQLQQQQLRQQPKYRNQQNAPYIKVRPRAKGIGNDSGVGNVVSGGDSSGRRGINGGRSSGRGTNSGKSSVRTRNGGHSNKPLVNPFTTIDIESSQKTIEKSSKSMNYTDVITLIMLLYLYSENPYQFNLLTKELIRYSIVMNVKDLILGDRLLN
nr:5180_t:CDS:2 [Entrophospora candida]